MKYRKVKFRDVMEVIWRLIFLVTVEVATALVLLPNHMFWWWVIIILLVAWVVEWHCRYFGYECVKCGHKQTITFIKEFLTINLFSRKYLKCEKCGKWSKARLLVVE
jgi:hypothetical protein